MSGQRAHRTPPGVSGSKFRQGWKLMTMGRSSRRFSRVLGVLLTIGALPVLSPLAPQRVLAAPAELAFVGSGNTAGNRTNHTVAIPAGVVAGDVLVAFLTTNTTNTTINDPAGWTLLE